MRTNKESRAAETRRVHGTFATHSSGRNTQLMKIPGKCLVLTFMIASSVLGWPNPLAIEPVKLFNDKKKLYT